MAKKKLTTDEFQEFVVKQFGVLHADVSGIRGDISEIRKEISGVHRTIDNIESVIEPLSTAFDKDAVKILQHDRRITRIEKRLGFRRA
jgi:archaellum component FlaC